MILQCIVIDDEPMARSGLEEYIQDVDFLQLKASFGNPLKAIDCIRQQAVDLLFLDIQMPRMTGLEFLKILSPAPMVVITTAYPQYAVEGFERDAIDYLLKPFSFDRFLKAALKARYLKEKATTVAPELPQAAEPDYFFIKSNNRLIRLPLNDILFAEALQNYTAIYTGTQKYLTYLTLQSLDAFLPPGRFIKTHKSFIVAIDKIDSIEGNTIYLGHHTVPISRSEKDTVMQLLLQNRLLKRPGRS